MVSKGARTRAKNLKFGPLSPMRLYECQKAIKRGLDPGDHLFRLPFGCCRKYKGKCVKTTALELGHHVYTGNVTPGENFRQYGMSQTGKDTKNDDFTYE